MSMIVYVNVLGGPPFQYVLPKLARLGDVTVVQPETMSQVEMDCLLTLTRNVIFYSLKDGQSFVEFLIDLAQKRHARALVTFDEFYLEDVAQASGLLNLRGPGAHVISSIRKDLMYEVFKAHDLLGRDYMCSNRPADLWLNSIAPPYVVKPSRCAASLGIFLIRTAEENKDFMTKFDSAQTTVHRVCGTMAGKDGLLSQPFIKEKYLQGHAEHWFGSKTPYADYISLEGIIIEGVYHPVAITQNYPLVTEFTETVSMTPTALPFERQIEIADKIKPCIESLGLEYCGVHTEIKLLAEGNFAIIESAARFAGWSIIPQVEAVFGIDLVTTLVTSLLDPTATRPPNFDEIWRRRQGGAATVNLLPVSETGEPWGSPIPFNGLWNLSEMVDERSQLEFTAYVGMGETIHPFSPLDGGWNSFGKLFLQSPDPRKMEEDIVVIRKNIRTMLEGVGSLSAGSKATNPT
jgi:hypothetical protein